MPKRKAKSVNNKEENSDKSLQPESRTVTNEEIPEGMAKMPDLPYPALCNYHLCKKLLEGYIFNRGRCEKISLLRRNVNGKETYAWRICLSYQPKIYSSVESLECVREVPPVDTSYSYIISSYIKKIKPQHYDVVDVYIEHVYLLGDWRHVWCVEMKELGVLEAIEGPARVKYELSNKKNTLAKKNVKLCSEYL